MKTAKLILAALICTLMPAMTFGQSDTYRGVSPVYIPGTQMDEANSIKTISQVSAQADVPQSETSNNSVSTGNSVQPVTSCGCQSGCGCGPDCCGSRCGCRGRVGRSFFQCLPPIGPIKLSLDCSRNCGGGTCGDCGCCDNRGLLARCLPFRIRVRSNACSRYVSFFGGYTALENYDGFVNFGTPMTREITFKDGYNLGAAIGRRWPNNFRSEMELVYRRNSADVYNQGSFVGNDFVPTATFDAINQFSSFSWMTNLLYDFNIRSNRTVPYIGLGCGLIWADGDIITPDLNRTDSINSEARWAYQLIGGISRQINCRLQGYVEYRYQGTSGFRVRDASMPNIDIGRFALQSSNVLFGFRWNLRNR